MYTASHIQELSVVTHCNSALKRIPVAVMLCLTSQRQSSITVSMAIKYSVPSWMPVRHLIVLLNGLLAKLIKSNISLPLVRVLYNWFSGLSC